MGHGVIVEIVKMDIIHALGDVRDPGELRLLGGGRQVDHPGLPCLSVLCGNFEIQSKEKFLIILTVFKRSRFFYLNREPTRDNPVLPGYSWCCSGH